MRLLVSVRDAVEAAVALAGGADIIDAKDPASGALGAVTVDALRAIVAAAGSTRPVTAALGDAIDASATEDAAREFAAAGVAFVKVEARGLAAAVRGVRATTRGDCGVVAAMYADGDPDATARFTRVVDAAAAAGASGVLLDTIDKTGPGLLHIVTRARLAACVTAAHARGLFIALAGRLSADDLPVVRETGADIAGVRSAACVGGRTGILSADRVRVCSEFVASGFSRTSA